MSHDDTQDDQASLQPGAPEPLEHTPLISAIIVSYNTCEMTLSCLRTLYDDLEPVGGASNEVWVVDNASRDNSVQAIREQFPQVRLIAGTSNIGFGAANNRAMAQAAGRYFLLLNSDAFPRPGALREMVKYLEEHPRAAVVGPRLLNSDGSLQISCFHFPSPRRTWLSNLYVSHAARADSPLADYGRWPHDSERVVDYIMGACMLVRREAYEAVGGFDEEFFLYTEETDWHLRLKQAGWQVAFTPRAEVTHIGRGSAAAGSRINKDYYNSLDFYVWKHHGTRGLLSHRLAWIAGSLCRLALWSAAVARSRGKSEHARSNMMLHAWIILRQATVWRKRWRTQAPPLPSPKPKA